ncbi:MAG TPA: HAMP domain-containing sensor histidine kinase [Anaeromyxobacteraceae bacterium]|nr:HAMP domain-containing sensor histidine kinase [Anaeromyxobacteraceae bacterium]
MLPGEEGRLPLGFDEIQRQELSRLYGRMSAVRLIFVPVLLALAVYLALAEPARWRAVFVFAVVLPLAAFFVVESLRFRHAGLSRAAVPVNLAAVLGGQSALAFATGGLESPVTYAFVPLAVMIGIFASRRARLALVAAQLAVVWGLAALEMTRALPDLNLALFGGGPRAGHVDAHLVATAALLSAVLALGSRAGRAVRQLFDRMLLQALRAREDSLRVHAERAEELTALSAEIAHELKNPLASVKGLAALLAEAPAPGRSAERLSVLRREIDRMQGVLDEFLNFSRPLVPLAVRPVELAGLAREVLALHEGMAQQRGIQLDLSGGPAEAACDVRKVKQVLMNLLQNAIEASPPGAVVEVLVLSAGPELASVHVLDRGGGLDETLCGRAFEAGVTSKPRGSGLGLTIARALARQHGGEVELTARAGGGCTAVLKLPAAPPAANPARQVVG